LTAERAANITPKSMVAKTKMNMKGITNSTVQIASMPDSLRRPRRRSAARGVALTRGGISRCKT